MDIEQVKPNKPNFLLVVILSSIAMLIILAGVILLLHMDKHLEPRNAARPHDTSILVSSTTQRA